VAPVVLLVQDDSPELSGVKFGKERTSHIDLRSQRTGYERFSRSRNDQPNLVAVDDQPTRKELQLPLLSDRRTRLRENDRHPRRE
jgi:hypothetical protein